MLTVINDRAGRKEVFEDCDGFFIWSILQTRNSLLSSDVHLLTHRGIFWRYDINTNNYLNIYLMI